MIITAAGVIEMPAGAVGAVINGLEQLEWPLVTPICCTSDVLVNRNNIHHCPALLWCFCDSSAGYKTADLLRMWLIPRHKSPSPHSVNGFWHVGLDWPLWMGFSNCQKFSKVLRVTALSYRITYSRLHVCSCVLCCMWTGCLCLFT